MSNLNARLQTVFELAAEIDRELVTAADETASALGTVPDGGTVSETDIERLTVILAEAADGLTSWSSDADVDELLTLGARMSVSSEAAMIEGATRPMGERAAIKLESDDVETLLQLIAAVSDGDTSEGSTLDVVNTPRRSTRRSAADDLARSIDDITLSRCTPDECDANDFYELIKAADIDFGAAFAGVSAATDYQYGMERQVVFQGRTVSASLIDWTDFLKRLSHLLGL